MAKKCMIHRDKKRNQKVKKAYEKREHLKSMIKDPKNSMDDKITAMKKLNKRPKNESVARHKNRCAQCGRPRGYLRKFGLCRICLRQVMMKGFVPGLRKASW